MRCKFLMKNMYIFFISFYFFLISNNSNTPPTTTNTEMNRRSHRIKVWYRKLLNISLNINTQLPERISGIFKFLPSIINKYFIVLIFMTLNYFDNWHFVVLSRIHRFNYLQFCLSTAEIYLPLSQINCRYAFFLNRPIPQSQINPSFLYCTNHVGASSLGCLIQNCNCQNLRALKLALTGS